MAKISIYVSPTSISIYDSLNNRISIRKATSADFKSAEITPEYNVQDTRVINDAYKLAAAVKTYLTKRSKDNFEKRFKKLQTLLSGLGGHSFETLYNRLDKAMNIKTEKVKQVELIPVECEAEAFVN
jgi:hypothetical protein